MTMNNEQILYPIGFKLVCKSESAYCAAVDETDESSETGSSSESTANDDVGSQNQESSTNNDYQQ